MTPFSKTPTPDVVIILLLVHLAQLAVIVASANNQCQPDSEIISCTKIRGVGCCIERDVHCDSKMDSSQDFPGAPTIEDVQVLENEDNLPQVNITWEGPGAGIRYLTGFRAKVKNDCSIIRFNTSLNFSMLGSGKLFNFTSGYVEYQEDTVPVRVTSLPIPNLPNPKEVFEYEWKKDSTTVNIQRKTDIKYHINTSLKNENKCQLRVQVIDKYIGTCNNVVLKKCKNEKCTKGRICSRKEVFGSNEWANLTVDVPERYYIEVMPSAVEGDDCNTSQRKGNKNRTAAFEIRGHGGSCFIVDPLATTQGQTTDKYYTTTQDSVVTKEISPLSESQTDDSTTNRLNTGMIGSAKGVNERSDSPSGAVLAAVPIAVMGVCACVLLGLCVLLRKRREKAGMLPDQILPVTINTYKTTNSTDDADGKKKAKFANYKITAKEVLVEWRPLVDNAEVVGYVVYLYDNEANVCIGKIEEGHSNARTMQGSFQIGEDVSRVHLALVTLFQDDTAEPKVVYSDVLSVPRPVEIVCRRVLLIYYSDSEEHVETVKEFARLLSASKCDVLFELWDTEAQIDRRRWYEDCLNKADKVIIIHSAGTFVKYEAYIKRCNTEDSLRDNFGLALNLILSHIEGRHEETVSFQKRLKHVYFSYTATKHLSSALINRAATYCIPANLKDLVLAIHDLPQSDKRADYELPGLDQKLLTKLQQAIERVVADRQHIPSKRGLNVKLDKKSDPVSVPKADYFKQYDSGIDTNSNSSQLSSDLHSNPNFQSSRQDESISLNSQQPNNVRQKQQDQYMCERNQACLAQPDCMDMHDNGAPPKDNPNTDRDIYDSAYGQSVSAGEEPTYSVQNYETERCHTSHAIHPKYKGSPKLFIPHSHDIYEGMVTPDVPTTLSPNIGPSKIDLVSTEVPMTFSSDIGPFGNDFVHPEYLDDPMTNSLDLGPSEIDFHPPEMLSDSDSQSDSQSES